MNTSRYAYKHLMKMMTSKGAEEGWCEILHFVVIVVFCLKSPSQINERMNEWTNKWRNNIRNKKYKYKNVNRKSIHSHRNCIWTRAKKNPEKKTNIYKRFKCVVFCWNQQNNEKTIKTTNKQEQIWRWWCNRGLLL